MYPIVIWFGEQKWQISLKSAQVDYPLISKAHALRVPHNCRPWLRGWECPAYPRSGKRGPICFLIAIRVCLLKVWLTPVFSPCASSYCVLSDWCSLGSPKPMLLSAQGAKCLHAFIWLYSGVCRPNPGSSCGRANWAICHAFPHHRTEGQTHQVMETS